MDISWQEKEKVAAGVRPQSTIYLSEVSEGGPSGEEGHHVPHPAGGLSVEGWENIEFAFREHVLEKYNITLDRVYRKHSDGRFRRVWIYFEPVCRFTTAEEVSATLQYSDAVVRTEWKWKFAGNSAAGNEVADDPPPGDDQADRHGALAIDSNKGGLYGWAVDYKTQAGAEERALNECGKNGGSCGLVMRFHNACAAYVADQQTGSTAYGWGWHETDRETAKGIAKTECVNRGGIRSRCITRVWGCTGSVGGGGGWGWTAPATPAGDVGGFIESVNASMHEEYWAYCWTSTNAGLTDVPLTYYYSSVFRTTENQVTLAMQYDSHMRARHDHLLETPVCTRSVQDDKAAAVEERDSDAVNVKNLTRKTETKVVFTHWAPP